MDTSGAQQRLEEALELNPRFKAEPLFSKTGVGSLSPASTEQYAKEVERCTDLTRKLTERAKLHGKQSAQLSKAS
jgi:hypothetical protein